jgi:hypothetical protein
LPAGTDAGGNRHQLFFSSRGATWPVDSETRTFTTKHGTVAKVNTAAIGKRSAAIPMPLGALLTLI